MGKLLHIGCGDGRFLESEIETGLIKNSMKINISQVCFRQIYVAKSRFPCCECDICPFLRRFIHHCVADTVLHHLAGLDDPRASKANELTALKKVQRLELPTCLLIVIARHQQS